MRLRRLRLAGTRKPTRLEHRLCVAALDRQILERERQPSPRSASIVRIRSRASSIGAVASKAALPSDRQRSQGSSYIVR
jgi:hypothetical protein